MNKIGYWIISISLVVLFGGGITLYIFNRNDLDFFFQALSSFSAFILGLLTAAYVFTTNRQLLVMENQISEMQKSRELDKQPLPMVEVSEVIIDKPKAFFTPPEGRIKLLCRLHTYYKIKNVGSGPALCIDITPTFKTKLDDNENYISGAVSERVEILEQGDCIISSSKNDPKQNIILSSLFTGDEKYITLKVLTQENFLTYPEITLTVTFKNFIGAYFKSECRYRLYPYNEDIPLLKDWLIRLSTLTIEFNKYIKQVAATQEDHLYLKKGFEIVKKEFDEKTKDITEDNISLLPHLLNNSFKVTQISEKEYQDLVKDIQYPKKIFAKRTD